MAKTISLNLSERYVSHWDDYAIAREFVSNAIDACGDDYKLDLVFNGFSIWTPTWPKIANLCIIGSGTKDINDDNIGQFGEGAKLAALHATRQGYTCRIFTPEATVDFILKEPANISEKVLHAVIGAPQPSKHKYGCLVTVTGYDASTSIANRFLTGDTRSQTTILPKDDISPLQIYLKGIFVAEEQIPSIANWNLVDRDIQINRDRSFVNTWTCRFPIGSYLTRELPNYPQVCQQLVANPNQEIWEWMCLQTYGSHGYDAARTVMSNAFREHYGNKAVVASINPKANTTAEYLGYRVIKMPQVFSHYIDRDIIKEAADVVPTTHDLDILEILPEWESPIAYMNTIGELIVNTYVNKITWDIQVFSHASAEGKLCGRCDKQKQSHNRYTILLADKLLQESGTYPTTELMSTFLHELTHAITGAGDYSLEFEAGLDTIAGILAMKLLKGGN